MSLWALPGVVLVAALAAFALRVRASAKRLAARTERLLSDPLEPRGSFPTVCSVTARHVRTVFAGEAIGPPLEWGSAVRLEVTERELRLEGEPPAHLPMRRIVDASLVGAFEGRRPGPGEALLGVTWTRGGERLRSVFHVARWADAEKVRRELHLRLHRGESA